MTATTTAPPADLAAPVPFADVTGGNRLIEEALSEAWRSVLASGRFVGGPEVELFEGRFAAYCGVQHGVGVGNGTDALELILAALGIGRGDEVVVPANTFVATAEAICAVGASPRFVDVLPGTLQADPDAVADAIGPRTAAVVAVHLFGQMADLERLAALTRRHGIALVEDAAQAHGARFAGRRAGSTGIAAAFSFYPGKNLGALGDGGGVVTDDAQLASTVRQLADHGRTPGRANWHGLRGRNSRLDALQAAVLSVKLARLDEDNARRRSLVQQYRASLPAHCVPVAVDPRAEPVHHLAVVRVPDRAAATAALDAAAIGWGVHYPVPCHLQPAFAEHGTGRLPVAEEAAGHLLSLPLSPTFTREQVERVCAVLARTRP